MKRFVSAVSAIVRKWPWWTIAVVVLATAVLGTFASRSEVTSGQEGFAPNTPEIKASNEIQQLFSTGGNEQTLQIILTGDNVVSADGVKTVQEVEDAIRERRGPVCLRP